MSLDVSLHVYVDTGGKSLRDICLFDSNITHNLGHMAEEAGIYRHLWRPEEIGVKYAKDIILAVEAGLNLMKDNPERFKKFDPPNGWGSYEHFISWVETYLAACKEDPKAIIEVSR